MILAFTSNPVPPTHIAMHAGVHCICDRPFSCEMHLLLDPHSEHSHFNLILHLHFLAFQKMELMHPLWTCPSLFWSLTPT